MLLSDNELRDLELVNPFHENLNQKGVLSWGLSAYGYDIRLSSSEMLYFSRLNPFNLLQRNLVVDPKHFTREKARSFMSNLPLKQDGMDSYFLVPPFAYCLGVSMEYIQVPNNTLSFTFNKSTYARCGLSVPATVLEPEWEGYLTLELKNQTPFPVKVYAGEGICQLVSAKGNNCNQSYRQRKGKYMYQDQEVVFPRIIHER